MGKELIDHFAKADQIFDYAARDEQQRDIDRSNQMKVILLMMQRLKTKKII
jgi:hypothetical protein